MPSSITHQLVAEETAKLLPEQIATILRFAPDEYFLGAQGPDMFFFYKIGSKKEYNIGKFLHRFRVLDTFELFLRAVAPSKEETRAPRFSEEERKRAIAYIFGYLTHYATDSSFHPFVYSFLERTNAQKSTHQQIESDWDVYFLRKLRGMENENFRFAFSPKRIVKNGVTLRLYQSLARHLERNEIKKGDFHNGLWNFQRFLRFFHGKCYFHHKNFYRLESALGGKRFLSALYPRKNPAEEYLCGELFYQDANGKGNNADELFALSVERSVLLIQIFYSAMQGNATLTRELFGRGFLTDEIV